MLFRPQALARVNDPDQLDQALRVVRPRHVLGFGVVAGVLVVGLSWSVLSTAPVKAAGPGVLLSPAGVASLVALDAGQVERLLIAPGDRVKVGQPVALIRQPERLDELRATEAESQDAQEQVRMLAAEFAAQERLQHDLMARVRAATAEQAERLEALLVSLRKRHVGEARLLEQGGISARQFYETESQLAQIEHDLATTRNRIAELALEHEQQAGRRQQDLAERRLRAENLTRRADNLRRDAARDERVLATTAGTVAEIAVDRDEPVSAGQTIARLLVDHDGERPLTALAWLPAGEGKKVKPGMPAHVIPSTVKFELEGYLLGRVTRVAELPASREGLLRRLKNAVLVEEILKSGTPFEVEVELQRDPATPSGYAWTSGTGPDLRIEPGTLARTEVVVERVHLISLLFPAMDYVFGWIKAR